MLKIAFMGAGSTIFIKNVMGDAMLTPALRDAEICLYDIDAKRLRESKAMLETLNTNINKGRAKITAKCGVKNRPAALRGAKYVVNAIQVGGYEPSTVIDFEIPKKYGLHQTIADTMGIGGIFRTLRTAPVMLDFARDMEKVCPEAWFLTYTNPMAMLTGVMLRSTNVKTVGLCHSVQEVENHLFSSFPEIKKKYKTIRTKVAGINHMAWVLEITGDGKDIYPEIKSAAKKLVAAERKKSATVIPGKDKDPKKNGDLVRLDLMLRFGYYITESSEHNAEYHPYFIKKNYPQLLEEYNIPLDEYPRRCVAQIAGWEKLSKEMVGNSKLKHKRTSEYGSYIMEAIETDKPIQIGGNVINHGLIPNLPSEAVVEVPCLVDTNGVQGTYVGNLPPQCAALNRTNINSQLLAIEAVLTKKKDAIYQAAMLDPHTAAELSMDEIVKMCNEMIKAHGSYLPRYR
jgi:alpha-galactosidase